MSGNKQAGAVSLFVVIFAMLIISVITVSFLRLMVADQRQATDADLSQSAYDSAAAGVEDAKRALLRYQQICRSDAVQCAALSDELSTDTCNAALLDVIPGSAVNGGTPANPGEVMVQQSVSGSDSALDQAYTCVTMKLKTDDYIGEIRAGETQLVPLIGEDGRTFDTVTVSWYSKENVGTISGAVDRLNTVSNQQLTRKDAWPTERPSVMRTQLIQMGDSFTLNDFNYRNSAGQANALTLFLYPSSAGGAANSDNFADNDFRKVDAGDQPEHAEPTDAAYPVRCLATVSDGQFACTMSLRLPEPIGGLPADGSNPTAYLRLTPYYNATNYRVVLSEGALNSSSLVKFQGVQPTIDATGRANDLFRRIEVRVDLFDTSFPYPDATVDVTGNFCKDFAVTDSQYYAGSCTP